MPNRIKLAKRLSVPLSVILPIATLYVFDPNSFQFIWPGRFYYLFFLWLFFLELALAWGKLPKNMLGKSKSTTIVAAVTMAIPTAYVIATFLFGLNQEIVKLGKLAGVPYRLYGKHFLIRAWPISFEYLLFTAFFVASVLFVYGTGGLKRFMVSLFFLGATGSFLMTDTFYPYGTLIALQMLVPLTASSATNVLNWIGYETRLFHFGLTRQVGNRTIEELYTIIRIGGEEQPLMFAINWPCAGVHSLLIYTFVILLFLKEAPFSLRREVVYAAIPKRLKFMAGSSRLSFLMQRKTTQAVVIAAKTLIVNVLRMVPVLIIVFVGAVGTFIVNVLRIVSIFIIGVNVGAEAAAGFHNYYGELYFIIWIMLYLLAIFFGPKILAKLVKMRRTQSQKV